MYGYGQRRRAVSPRPIHIGLALQKSSGHIEVPMLRGDKEWRYAVAASVAVGPGMHKHAHTAVMVTLGRDEERRDFAFGRVHARLRADERLRTETTTTGQHSNIS